MFEPIQLKGLQEIPCRPEVYKEGMMTKGIKGFSMAEIVLF